MINTKAKEHRTADEWYLLGYSLLSDKKYEKTVTAFEKAIKINPNYVTAWNGKGAALEKIKKYDKALAAYDEAIGIDPDLQTTINNRNILLEKESGLQSNFR